MYKYQILTCWHIYFQGETDEQQEDGEEEEEIIEVEKGKKEVSLISYFTKKIECKIVNIFLPISFNICFGCSKEGCSFEYPQHMFWLKNKKIIFCYTLRKA